MTSVKNKLFSENKLFDGENHALLYNDNKNLHNIDNGFKSNYLWSEYMGPGSHTLKRLKMM
jgi:hypothetical protein